MSPTVSRKTLPWGLGDVVVLLDDRHPQGVRLKMIGRADHGLVEVGVLE